MLIIRIKDPSSTWIDLDVYENEPISISYAVQERHELSAPIGSYSQSLRIPATDNNIAIFGTQQDPNLVSSFMVKRKYDAQVLHSGIPILTGHVQLKRAIVRQGLFADFEIVVFGESVDFSRAIGDTLLSKLNWTDLAHDVSYSNVVASWTGGLLSGSIRYGIIDRGTFDWGISGNSASESNALNPTELVPFVKLSEFIDKIFQAAEFEYQSDFFNDDISQMYVPAYVGGAEIAIGNNPYQQWIIAGLTSNYSVSTQGLVVLPLVDSPAPFFDNPNDFDNTTHLWTSAYSGMVVAVVYLNVSCSTFIAGQFAKITIRISEIVGSSVVSYTYVGAYELTYENPILSITDISNINVISGRKYRLSLEIDNPTNNTLTFAANDIESGCAIQYVLQGEVASTTCDISKNLPEYKAIDFLMDLQKMFNLVFEPDKANPKLIHVEPSTNYFGTGEVLDWTDKVDYMDTDVVISPTTDMQSKTYEWTFSEADDIVNDAYVNSANRVFGRYRILDAENDFATGNETIEVGFAPFVVNTQSGKTLFRGYTEDSEPISEPPLMLAYWNGMHDGNWHIMNGGTTVLRTQYPAFSQFTTLYASIDDDALQFGADAAHVVEAIPVNTLYHNYWHAYVRDMYSEESRIMECDIFLQPSDIASFNFNNLVRTKEGVWRVQEISGYIANDEATCSVVLLKWLGSTSIPRCQYTPNAVTTGGVVLFSDEDGNTGLSGSQTCCELYGYQWNGTQCIGRAITAGAGGASGGSSLSLGAFSGVLTPSDVQNINENLSSFVEETTNNFDQVEDNISDTELFTIFFEK